MALVSFVGRLLFASIFILSAWKEFSEFGNDGGPAAQALAPKFNVLTKHIATHAGFQVPSIEMKNLVTATIVMKGAGGFLFIFGSSLGAYLLLFHQTVACPILYDFYNFDADTKDYDQLFTNFTEGLALFGALLFFIGMKNSIPRRNIKRKIFKSKTA